MKGFTDLPSMPKQSGEYLVILDTPSGPVMELLNYGCISGNDVRSFYWVTERGCEPADNIVSWCDPKEIDTEVMRNASI